ncbi:MAG TPA: glycogen debranching enzyme GlgX [Sedimenticola sp.]|nr:glycogen debranching enzyme GlgX [Sedimenticola sp.]
MPIIEAPYPVSPGRHHPYGATPEEGGVNFSVFSLHAIRAELLLFEGPESPEPFQVIDLEPDLHRTFYTWHLLVEGLPAGVWYSWRMDGPGEDTRLTGDRFDPDKHLLDPRARVVSHTLWQRIAACRPGDNGGAAMRAMVVSDGYDWEGDRPLQIPSEESIIYELHVGGFTRHPSAGVAMPGTFKALIEKIPYLQMLGITHVELLPVMAFDEQDVPEATARRGLKNYWGYSTHSFFAPHPGYCISPDRGTQLTEFRDLVKALHRAGIGIILDVVYNHTAEGGADGPVINFKGFGGGVFYHLDPEDRRRFRDYTGCGNTVNANHPVVSAFIIDSLEFWVREMHVDGFRFDLASALARGEDGAPLHDAPVLWGIELSEQLAGSRLIAEAWDAAGLYQVGSFPGCRWADWNGRYRDVVRRFLRGEGGLISELATRLAGSSDLYLAQGRLPINSINFVTCHDGFTLYDLFSYREKHNLANGEENRDGSDENLSCNCGVEGETDDPAILDLRRRLARNAVTILLLSQGVPMLLAGDEVLRSQQGNNNGWCQDNELSWFDWQLLERNGGMLRFVREMIALRKRHPSLMRRRFLRGELVKGRDLPDVSWHGSELEAPPWDDPEARCLAFTLAGIGEGEPDLHVMMNLSDERVGMALPPLSGRHWERAVDTWRASPDDILSPGRRRPWPHERYPVEPRSLVVFESTA